MQTDNDNQPDNSKLTVAHLDANGVYWGLTQIDAAGQTPEHVVLPECDLPPGRYRWNADAKQFEPLAAPITAPEQPSLEAVVYELVKEAIKDGSASPVLTAYKDHFQKSIDAIKSIDGGAK